MNIATKVIANKRVSISEEEYKIFLSICENYKDYGGEILFNDLFETNSNGVITLIIPPTNKIPIDVYLFVMTLQQSQMLRHMEQTVISFLQEMRQKYDNENK